ncbi:MAG: DUF4097 family beta strand repeat protein [Woeseia sp.]|nr:DUF4097 family beta strand repeat protein [Woeseia sp.]MBT6211509.1 DUF4097 family beta strand repeat protein [Woeseia sp.]
MEAVSGDLSISSDNQESNARLTTVSGDIDIENLAGELKTETVSGDISIIDSSFSRISAETVNGRVRIRTLNSSVRLCK